MKSTKFLFLFLIVLLSGCKLNDTEMNVNSRDAVNQVLMLKVDYTTNVFEGGTVFYFDRTTDSFTIENEYIAPGDFGSVKLIYKELDKPLFEGSIHWMGLGKITFPEKLESANRFKIDSQEYYVYPKNGFEDVFNPDNRQLNYEKPWSSVQNLVKVREFLTINPNQKVKMFLYTPSVGEGDPKDWYWVIYLNR